MFFQLYNFILYDVDAQLMTLRFSIIPVLLLVPTLVMFIPVYWCSHIFILRICWLHCSADCGSSSSGDTSIFFFLFEHVIQYFFQTVMLNCRNVGVEKKTSLLEAVLIQIMEYSMCLSDSVNAQRLIKH